MTELPRELILLQTLRSVPGGQRYQSTFGGCGRGGWRRFIITSLENYLRVLSKNRSTVTLTFEQVEVILNAKLPSSAYEDRRWWEHEKEGNHVNKRSWVNAGWKIESLDVNQKRVKFVRDGQVV